MIFIDGIVYSLQKSGGVSVYFDEIVKEVERKSMPYELLLHHDDASKDNTLVRPPRFQERYRDVTASPEASVFISSYYRRVSKPQIPSVVVVHDFVYEACLYGPRVTVHKWEKYRAIRAASEIICISEATRQDLFKYFGKPSGNVHVIHNGASDIFHPQSPIEEHDGYVLFVGKRGLYKNFSLLVEAMAQLPGLDLVCVGGEPWSDKERADTEAAIHGNLSIQQGISTEALAELYDRATALVYPSLYEGFGIPVLEAMRAGCPAIAVNCRAVREAGGEALVVAENNTAREIADHVRRMTGPDRRATVQAGLVHSRKFSWSKCSAAVVEILSRYL